jgi:5'-3' exonuclease
VQEKTNNVAIFDADFIPFYVCHVKKGNPYKSLDDCKNLVDDLIRNVNKSVNADYMIVCLTSGKCFRYQVYPEYKSNRKYSTTPDWLFETKQYLIDDYSGIISKDLYEADDLVCIYKNMLLKKGYSPIIISPDKDILNLEGTHYNPKYNEFVTTTANDAAKYFWKSMITGDSADGLCGIKGIGEKGAEVLLEDKHIDIFKSYRDVVFDKYCEVYGESYGIEMFYKMYKCLTMVQHADMSEPPLINLKLNSEEEGILNENR